MKYLKIDEDIFSPPLLDTTNIEGMDCSASAEFSSEE